MDEQLELILPNEENQLRDIIEHFNNEEVYFRLGRKFIIKEISAPFDHQPNFWKVTVKLSEVR